MSTSDASPRAAATPGEPRWLLSGLYAALATLAVCWPAWPGMMSYDSLFAYQEAQQGITSMSWPPMHAYLFFLSRAVGAQTWGLFVFQTFLLFFGAAVAVNLLIARRGWAIAALGAFALGFVYVPELLGSALAHWRDVTTTSFAVAGLAGWLFAARYRSIPALIVAGVCLSIAAALRYNTIVLLVGVVPLMVWRPFLQAAAPRKARVALVATLVIGLGLAWASTHWRLPDFKRVPAAGQLSALQEFDLIGISACADRTYLPPSMTGGWPISPREIRQAYDPRHMNKAFHPVPGAPQIQPTDVGGEIGKIWPIAVRHDFGCYLAHRAAVFVEQMGMAKGDVFYASEDGIIANPYGLKPAHPHAMEIVVHYIAVRAKEIWRRPFLVYLLAPIAVGVLWRTRSRLRLLAAAMLAGGLAYPAALFFIGPAADARYIFPSSVLCVLLLSAGAAVFMEERGPIQIWRLGFGSRLRARRNGASLVVRLRWSRS